MVNNLCFVTTKHETFLYKSVLVREIPNFLAIHGENGKGETPEYLQA